VLVFAGPQPVTKLAELEQVSSPAITKMVSALESAGLAQREGSKTTGAWCLSRPLRPESVYWSGTGQPGCERSPHCLLTPPRRSCRLCARLRMLLRPGSRRAARDCPFHELVVDRPSRTSIEPVTKRAVRSMYRTAAASTHGDRCRDTRPCHRQEARCA